MIATPHPTGASSRRSTDAASMPSHATSSNRPGTQLRHAMRVVR